MPDAPMRDLTSEEVEAYDRDGVICARGLFPEEWIERMATAIDRVVENPTMMGNVVSMKDDDFSGDLFIWKLDDDFRDFVYESPASRIAQQVLGSKVVRHFYDQLFVKPAGCHVPTPWHHDVTFWPVDVSSQNLCSMWITFDPVDRASSGLEFVKGSHRWPRLFKAVTPNYDPYMLDSDFDDAPAIDDHREDYDLFCPDMEPGDILLFNAHVVHGSSSNYSTDRPRRAFASRWCDDSILFESRHATMPLLWDHGLSDGDPISGSLFPQVLPDSIAEEGARRAEAPEPPDPEYVARIFEAITERASASSSS
ncbi:MAG: phytanoyl-CoA dioxygenase family protein [Myxococcales bacterium]|nr:phytanoyl-CoA dioxygenase family protein [Myxococcales bacterium]HIK84808.1 phytanoyl-CoA dioxygenase family protein [Myxococcales bacterium]